MADNATTETPENVEDAVTSARETVSALDSLTTIPALESASVGIPILVIGFIALYFMRRYANKQHQKQPFRIFVNRLLRPAVILLLLTVAKSSLAVKNYYLPETAADMVAHSFNILIIIIIGWMMQRAVFATKTLIIRNSKAQTTGSVHARRRYTQIEVIGKVVSFIIVVLTIAAISLTFDGVAMVGESLLASAGVAGIILGFAAQKTIGNLFAGIQIAIAQPIRIEDVVIVENEWGWIEEINLTYVVIRIWDLRRLVVPITYFTEKPFQNWTRNEAEIIGTVVMYLDYTVPMEAMREKLNEVLDNTKLWNGNVRVLQTIDCKEQSMVVRALMTGKDAPTTWDLRCHVREELLQWLAEEYPETLPRTRMELEYQQATPATKATGKKPNANVTSPEGDFQEKGTLLSQRQDPA